MVISGGRDDAWHAVARTFQQFGAQVLHTTYDGAVRSRFTAAGVEVWRWHQGQWRPCPTPADPSVAPRAAGK